MSKLFNLTPSKSYATEANAIKAFEKIFADEDVRYFIARTADGERFFPVAIGQKAIDACVHFHFNVIF